MKQNKLDKPCNKDLSIFFTEREYQDKKEKEEKKEPDKMSENDSNMVSKTDKYKIFEDFYLYFQIKTNIFLTPGFPLNTLISWRIKFSSPL